MTNEGNDTFMRITNRDIYDKIEEQIKSSSKKFNEINLKIDGYSTRLKITRWMAGTSLTLVILVIGALLKAFIIK